ncbi:MAG: energy transducer TonB, partial [Lysobacter sp.]|nr:energy transducer TonB [Lysobacter sp.]
DPGPMDTPAPPPAPPAPPAAATNIGSSVDPSSRALNPPKYPPQEARQGVGGTVILMISIDASGNVLNVEVEKSSRNRNLDRAAIDAARKWRFNPETRNGVAVASRVRVPVDFVPPT